jgi:hypothetical protein
VIDGAPEPPTPPGDAGPVSARERTGLPSPSSAADLTSVLLMNFFQGSCVDLIEGEVREVPK